MKTTLIVTGSVLGALLTVGVIALLLTHPDSPVSIQPKPKQYNVKSILSSVKSKFRTVTDTKVYTEKNDPNGTLGKPGSYIQGGAFADSRVEDCDTTADDWATECGGSVEVYRDGEEAQARVEYLANFQTGILSAGSSKQVGSVVIRTSNDLQKSQQDELTSYIEDLL